MLMLELFPPKAYTFKIQILKNIRKKRNKFFIQSETSIHILLNCVNYFFFKIAENVTKIEQCSNNPPFLVKLMPSL